MSALRLQWAILVASTLTSILVGCAVGDTKVDDPCIGDDEVVDLEQRFVPLIPGADHEVEGTYLEVSGGECLDLVKVNDLLRRLVIDDQERVRESFGSMFEPGAFLGTYYAKPEAGWRSTNSHVVSVLIPAGFDSLVGSTDDHWLSLTVIVPVLAEVLIADLFSQEDEAPAVLEELSKKEIRTSGSSCYQAIVDDPTLVYAWDSLETYAKFGATPDGLAVGFDKYQIAPGACGATSVLLPWSSLDQHLSDVARNLVEYLR